jgi:hypothetical protein
MSTPEQDGQPAGPEPIWVYDHTEQCGNKIRIRESQRAEFETRSRGECATCHMALPEARPATAEDW